MSAKRPHQKRTKSGPEKRREDLKDKTPHIGDEKNQPVDNSGSGKPDPHATNSVIDGYVPSGGSGALGKFTMPDSWTPDPDFTKRAALHEVKGFWTDDARVKTKVAADQYPFRIIGVTVKPKKAGGGWNVEEF